MKNKVYFRRKETVLKRWQNLNFGNNLRKDIINDKKKTYLLKQLFWRGF